MILEPNSGSSIRCSLSTTRRRSAVDLTMTIWLSSVKESSTLWEVPSALGNFSLVGANMIWVEALYSGVCMANQTSATSRIAAVTVRTNFHRRHKKYKNCWSICRGSADCSPGAESSVCLIDESCSGSSFNVETRQSCAGGQLGDAGAGDRKSQTRGRTHKPE